VPDRADIFDLDLLRRRRDRIAGIVPPADFLLARVAEDFAERLQVVRRTFPLALNLGAYNGALSRGLKGISGIERVIDVEPSARLLTLCDGPRVEASPEALPFANAKLDLVVSALALQLVNDLPGVLVQVLRSLKPDGLFLAALLGGETLKELRESWLVAETEITGGASPRVAPFADLRDLGGLLQRAGFAQPVVDADIVTVAYASPLALMRELKAMGASNPLTLRARVPMTRALLARACEVYTERFARPDGRIPATFEILTLTAWSPHESQQKPLKPGSARMRLADALGVPERSTGEKP
jgi:SAM-dependent methyltransferase